MARNKRLDRFSEGFLKLNEKSKLYIEKLTAKLKNLHLAQPSVSLEKQAETTETRKIPAG